jgi:chaperonin GroES
MIANTYQVLKISKYFRHKKAEKNMTNTTAPLAVEQLHPTPGYILVEPAKSQKQTSSGLYLPDSHDEQLQHGAVLAVGDAIYQDGKETSSPAKKGDMVVFKKWGGNEVKIGDIEYQILKFEDVLAIVK